MPVLTHPTEWPEATKRGLTHRIGPLPVWAWGTIIVGAVVVFRALHKGTGKAPSNAVAGATGLLPPGGTFSGYGGGSGGGGSSLTSSDTLAPASHGSGVSPGGVGSAPLGAIAPGSGSILQGDIFTNTQSAPGRTGLTVPTDLRTVGPLTYPPDITTAQRAAADAQNMSLVDWYVYQFSQGVKNPSMYGPNAGAPQKQLDAEAMAAAQKLYAQGARYNPTPGYVNGVYVGVG